MVPYYQIYEYFPHELEPVRGNKRNNQSYIKYTK